MPFVQGAGEIGKVLQDRGEQLIQEYDTTKAMGAYNKLREESRGKVTELLQREGSSAQGVQTEYEEWYEKTNGNIQSIDLTVSRQREIFQDLAEKRRQSDLDELAGHEARQHQAYKKEVVEGMGETLEIDIRGHAFDDAKQDEMIDDYFTQLDRLYPGHDLTAVKAQSLQKYRLIIGQQLTEQNPEYAEEWIEKHKKQLGEHYLTLKSKLKNQGRQNRVDSAIGVLQNEFGSNHEAALVQVASQKNWKKYGLKNNDEAEEVRQYIRSMITDRDRAEAKGEDQKQKTINDTQLQILVEFYDPETERTIDIHEEARNGNVTANFYKFINSLEAKESVEDNWEVHAEIYETAESGDFDTAKKMISKAVENGNIKGTTAIQLSKTVTDTRYGRAARSILSSLDPAGPFDRYAQDKQLRKPEAMNSFYTIVRETGRPPEDVAMEIINRSTAHLRRSVNNIPMPRLLKVPSGMSVSEAKRNIDVLGATMEATEAFYRAGRIGEKEYLLEMKNLRALIDNARSAQAMEDSAGELEEAMKKLVVD